MQERKPRVVVVGAGFGGLFAVKALRKSPVDITLIDKRNYHLFQPLLYQVATAGLAPSDIAWPIRAILTRQDNVSVLLGEVSGIDTARQQIALCDQQIDYDYLLLATGSKDAFFGHDEWRRWTIGLKSIEDATSLRRQLLMAFERAEASNDDDLRERLMRIIVVGAGPTGVELAGAIAELARHTLARDFRNIDTSNAQVVLLEAGDRVLSAFDPKLSDYAKKSLEKLGVDVRLNTKVHDCTEQGVDVGDGQVVRSSNIIWAAGVAAAAVDGWSGAPTDAGGRVLVTPELTTPDHANIFVIGDAAHIDQDGVPVPGIAPAAKQQGKYVAKVIDARVRRWASPEPFHYRHAGDLATIGRRAAVVEIGRFRLKGRLAWWLWGFLHIYFLIGLSSPLIVSIRWLWQYLTYGRGARLITGDEGREPLL